MLGLPAFFIAHRLGAGSSLPKDSKNVAGCWEAPMVSKIQDDHEEVAKLLAGCFPV